MSLLHTTFYSESIHITTNMTVILPEAASVPPGGWPTLYLLHGYTDDYNAWTRWTAVERYARDYRLAVVMPDVQKSFYSDFAGMKNGYKYWTFVSEELIGVTRRLFRLSELREDTFVAGLSMGGFGAFKCALNRPDVFGAGASLSGLMETADMEAHKAAGIQPSELEMVLGDLEKQKGGQNDLFAAAERTAKLSEKPRLYQFCGTGDFLYSGNVRFRENVQGLGYDYTYEECPGGHDWALWDRYIRKVIKWLNLEKLQ